MTPVEFKNAWEKTEGKTSPIPSSQLVGLGLNDATRAFLTESGFPEEAAPLLTFVQASGDLNERIGRIEERWGLGADAAKYIRIGSNGCGNLIVVNTAQLDRVECLDHENQFESTFMNTSVQTLAAFILHYTQFIDQIRLENGPDAFLDSNFSEAQVNALRMNMVLTDKLATEIGFWSEELNNLAAESC